MANQEQVNILKQGVSVWNKWREKNRTVVIDLTGSSFADADLSSVDLRRAYLSKTDFRDSNLQFARLSKANLKGAYLFQADLHKADLTEAVFDQAFLYEINLSEAMLYKTNFVEAVFRGANFSNARLALTIFGSVDLSEVIGLGNVIHRSSSIVGVETLRYSKGKIPEVFLRGCGLSDWEIEAAKLYKPDLNNQEMDEILYRVHDIRAYQPVQISPLFISYSHADSLFVDKLEGSLNERGVRFWRDIHDATSGRLEKQIDRAIRQNPTVVLILSENSIKSDWVQHEARRARDLEKELGRDVLCPVALDDSWKSSPWPERIMEQVKEYNILDFSKWDENANFKNMFGKLISGLNLYYKK